MHLSKGPHINGTMYLPFDVLAYRPQGSSMLCGHQTLLFKGWTVFTIFFFTCSFIHQWILGLLPYFDSCEYCCDEYRWSNICSSSIPVLFCFYFQGSNWHQSHQMPQGLPLDGPEGLQVKRSRGSPELQSSVPSHSLGRHTDENLPIAFKWDNGWKGTSPGHPSVLPWPQTLPSSETKTPNELAQGTRRTAGGLVWSEPSLFPLTPSACRVPPVCVASWASAPALQPCTVLMGFLVWFC